MREPDTQRPNADPDNRPREPGAAPDVVRRRLAKAALTAPVILSLKPRGVLGEIACPSSGNLFASLQNAGGVAGLSLAPNDLRADQVERCDSCVTTYAERCEDVGVDIQEFCETDLTADQRDQVCPTPQELEAEILEELQADAGGGGAADEGLLSTAPTDCVPQAAAPAKKKKSGYEEWSRSRSEYLSRWQGGGSAPGSSPLGAYGSGTGSRRSDAWTALRQQPETRVAAPSPTPASMVACGTPGKKKKKKTKKMSRMELWESVRSRRHSGF